MRKGSLAHAAATVGKRCRIKEEYFNEFPRHAWAMTLTATIASADRRTYMVRLYNNQEDTIHYLHVPHHMVIIRP